MLALLKNGFFTVQKKAPFYGKIRAPSLGLPVRVVDCGLGRPAAVFGEKQNKKAVVLQTKQNKTKQNVLQVPQPHMYPE